MPRQKIGKTKDAAAEFFKNIMSHASLSNLVIHCADGRLMRAIYEWLNKQDVVGHCDELSLAGGCKDLVSPQKETDRDYVLRQIGTLRRLHGTQRIFLINHTGCGAYGGESANKAQEIEKHAGDLHEAASLIQKQWPDMELRKVLIIMEGDEVKDFQEVR